MRGGVGAGGGGGGGGGGGEMKVTSFPSGEITTRRKQNNTMQHSTYVCTVTYCIQSSWYMTNMLHTDRLFLLSFPLLEEDEEELKKEI